MPNVLLVVVKERIMILSNISRYFNTLIIDKADYLEW